MPHLSELKPRAPQGNKVTEYDREHFDLYLRLLDGEAASEPWEEVATRVMGLEIDDIEAARLCWQSHLERARWMSKEGYLQLLDSSK